LNFLRGWRENLDDKERERRKGEKINAGAKQPWILEHAPLHKIRNAKTLFQMLSWKIMFSYRKTINPPPEQRRSVHIVVSVTHASSVFLYFIHIKYKNFLKQSSNLQYNQYKIIKKLILSLKESKYLHYFKKIKRSKHPWIICIIFFIQRLNLHA